MSYHRPTDLSEALSALRPGVVIAGGCTDIFPATEAPELSGDILDITGIAGLRGVSRDGAGWRIGAATTWTDVIRADLPPAFEGLKAAAQEVGSVQIQNAGTVAGNICNASPAADGVPPLLTLGAAVEVASTDGVRQVPLADFITGVRQVDLRPTELVTAIVIPQCSGRGAFVKLGARRYLVISIAMAAARLVVEDGLVTQAAVSVGACSPVAVRLPKVERALTGGAAESAATRVSAADVALSPIDDMRADAGYRAEAAVEVLRRAVAGAVA